MGMRRYLIALSLFCLVLASSAAWAQQPIKAHLVLTTGVFGSKFSGSNAANSCLLYTSDAADE